MVYILVGIPSWSPSDSNGDQVSLLLSVVTMMSGEKTGLMAVIPMSKMEDAQRQGNLWPRAGNRG